MSSAGSSDDVVSELTADAADDDAGRFRFTTAAPDDDDNDFAVPSSSEKTKRPRVSEPRLGSVIL